MFRPGKMYCHNQLLNHPLVSPVNAGSLGGLPPLYIVSAFASLEVDHCLTYHTTATVLRWIRAFARRNHREWAVPVLRIRTLTAQRN